MGSLFQTLTNATDRALYIRIKVQHPLWSDELIKKEIENLHQQELADLCKELFCKGWMQGAKNRSS